MVREKFQRYFFHEKDSNFNSQIVRLRVFVALDKYLLRIRVKNTVFAIQHRGNKKKFY